jgi:ribosomal-protein-alanine acetyltransferase
MLELERQSSSSAHWTREQYERRFAATNSERSESLVLVSEGESASPETAPPAASVTLAFLVAQRIDNEWELENVVVAENARRRGIGSLLSGELIDYVKRTGGSAIFLEVRESNHSARALYRKMGFEQAGRRSRYYSNPPEDAILYRIRL